MKLPPPAERGWLSFAFGAEVYSAVAIAIFLPIVLEQLAREVGFSWPNHLDPCDAKERCSVRIAGKWVDTASFSLYTKSFAVAVQALSVVSIGVLADDGHWRKRLLVVSAWIGSLSAILFLAPFQPSTPALLSSALLTAIGNTTYAISTVCNNAYLPLLAKASPEVQATLDEGLEEEVSLLPSSKRHNAALTLAISRISARGIALGFTSGVVLLTLLTIPVIVLNGSTASLRIAVGISGIWWAVFTFPAAWWLPSASRQAGIALIDIKVAWQRLGRMVRVAEMRRLKNTFTFLLAWVFLSDGFHTTTTTSIIFAKTTLHMPSSSVITLGILVQAFAIISAISMPRYQAYKGWTNLETLIRLVIAGCVIPGYAALGVLTGSERWGLVTAGEMYAASIWFGLIYGPFNSYSRALYAEIIPPTHEARFFSLFAVTDKSASFLGPAVVGLIADHFGSIRYAFFFLLAMLLIPLPILYAVDVDEGRAQAGQYAAEEAMK